MTRQIQHLKLKDALLFGTSFVLGIVLFLTIGTLKHPHQNLDGCTYLDDRGNMQHCTQEDVTGYPLAFFSERPVGGVASAQAVLIDAVFWWLIGGGIVMGAVLILPEKASKKTKK